jgi:septal ring factor EnvC (AmiA/AmiB activator)
MSAALHAENARLKALVNKLQAGIEAVDRNLAAIIRERNIVEDRVAALSSQIQLERVDAQARLAMLGKIIAAMAERAKAAEVQIMRMEDALSRSLTVCAAPTQTGNIGTEAPRV